MDLDDCQDCLSFEMKNNKGYCIELDEYIEDISMCPEHDHEFGDDLPLYKDD